MTDTNPASSSTSPSRDVIRSLIADLESDDSPTRMKARAELQEIGPAAVEALVSCLYDPGQHVRWEAAKTLASIADPSAALALVSSLDDDDQDVRWVAGEALVALRDRALPALLMGLIRHSNSVDFCRAAHHVLHDLNKRRDDKLLTAVIQALESAEPAVAAPPAAYQALRAQTIDVGD